MKKLSFSRMAAIIVLLLALTSCSSVAARLTEKDNGQIIDLNAGDTFTVKLAGNPTTGYSWEASGIDPAMLELAGEPGYKSDSKLIGSGGVYTFTIKAIAPGSTTINLVYHRSWETDVDPLETFTVTVNVK